MKVSRTINFLSTLTVIAVFLVTMCTSGFTWLLFLAIIVNSIYLLVLTNDIISQPIDLSDPLEDYPVGTQVQVVGNTGMIKHNLQVGSVYTVAGRHDGTQIVVKSSGVGYQYLELRDVKIFMKV